MGSRYHSTKGHCERFSKVSVTGAADKPETAAAAAVTPFSALDPAALKEAIAQQAMDPSTFQPVCPASDGLYRLSQSLVLGVVGSEHYREYAPLIAGGLLRVRLELCVVESFVYEAIIPFVREKGLSWARPFRGGSAEIDHVSSSKCGLSTAPWEEHVLHGGSDPPGHGGRKVALELCSDRSTLVV